MTTDTYRRFVKRGEEVTDLPPQTVGPLTPYYKALTRHLKVMPWPLLVLGAVCMVVGLYVILGSAITLVVSLLQKGL